ALPWRSCGVFLRYCRTSGRSLIIATSSYHARGDPIQGLAGSRPGSGRNQIMKKLMAALAAVTALSAPMAVHAQDDAVRIALLHGLSGSPLEAYSKQTHAGFQLGLEYATGGTMEIKGKPIELIIKDTQFK